MSNQTEKKNFKRKRGRPKNEEIVEVKFEGDILLGSDIARLVAELIYQLWKKGKR